MALKDVGLEKLKKFGATEEEAAAVGDLFDTLPPKGDVALVELISFSRNLPGETPRRRASKVARLAVFLAPHAKEFKARVLGFLTSPTTKMNLLHARRHNHDLLRENALDLMLQTMRVLSRVYTEEKPVRDEDVGAALAKVEVVFTSFLENTRRAVDHTLSLLDPTSPTVARDLEILLRGLSVVGLNYLSLAAKRYKSPKEIVLSAARELLASLERRSFLEVKLAADREDRVALLRTLIAEVELPERL